MFCTNCGKRLTDDAKHCPNCGVLIVREEAAGSSNAQSQEKKAYSDSGYSYDEFKREEQVAGEAPAQKPYTYTAPPAPTKEDGYALTGLILAIVSAVCCCAPFIGLPCAIIGIIFAAKGMKSVTRHSMAVVALILGIIFAFCNAAAIASLVIALLNGDRWNAIFDEISNIEEFRYYFPR